MTLVFGLAAGLASVFVVTALFRIQTDHLVTYSADDAAAMTWLNQHAQPGEVLLNDGAADAGIWAPYKTPVSIVLLHTQVFTPGAPEVLLRANLGQLDARPDVRESACALHVQYVYRGAAPSPEARQFPRLEDLRQVAALEEIFSSREAAIFRTRLGCPP